MDANKDYEDITLIYDDSSNILCTSRDDSRNSSTRKRSSSENEYTPSENDSISSHCHWNLKRQKTIFSHFHESLSADISTWDSDVVFPLLHICFTYDTSLNYESQNFVQTCMKNIFCKEEYKAYMEFRRKDVYCRMMCSDIERHLDIMTLDIENINGAVKPEYEISLCRQLNDLKQRFDSWECLMPLDKDRRKLHTRWCLFGKKFTEQLKLMVVRMKKQKCVEKGMFQNLFMYFLEMFSLDVHGGGDVDEQTMEFICPSQSGEENVCSRASSTADILIAKHDEELNSQVLSVVQIEKEYGINEPQIIPGTSCKSSFEHQFTSKILGRHGGELLINLPISYFKESGVLGMIIQATEVSFTSLVSEPDFTRHVKNGFKDESKAAGLFISETHNFLTIAGRENLKSSLMELYYLQTFLTAKIK